MPVPPPPAAISAPAISFANTVPELLAYFANDVCEVGWRVKVVPGSGHVRYAVNCPARIAFQDLGGAGGGPLLLVIGWPLSRFWWRDAPVSEFVRRGFHVVAYDQRDAGQSTH